MSLVSIIVPCYNYGWLLSETLDSVLAQTYTQWECIIIDDGSIDNTQHVATRYQGQDSRFRYQYQSNGGMSSARNYGLSLAQGKYIQFLDADDLLKPQKLAIQVAYLDAHPEVDVVYGDVRYFRHNEPTVLNHSIDMKNTIWMSKLEGKGIGVIERLVEQNQLVINAPLLRSAMAHQVGLFSETLRSMEDWEFWLRCAIQGACFHYQSLPETWALVRVHPTSTSQNKPRMLSYARQVREQLDSVLSLPGTERAKAINQVELIALVKQHYEEQALAQFSQGNKKAGLHHLWRVANYTGRYGYYLRSALYWLRKSLDSTTDIGN